jgi:phenylpropionate dioxygenase-like ring-hydroxylating dioxygenase large terminal subunit
LGHTSQVQNAGEYIASDIAGDRVLGIRDKSGVLRAFRNSCVAVPHLLLNPGSGQITSIVCESHGLRHGLDGRGRGDDSASLFSLQLRIVNNLILVRSEQDGLASMHESWEDAVTPGAEARFLSTLEREIAADWKLIVESWLRARLVPSEQTWSARAYAASVGQSIDSDRTQFFIGPNHWLDVRRDGLTVLQVVPRTAGRSILRQHDYSWGAPGEMRAAAYLASRLNGQLRSANIRSLESAQTSIVAYGYPSRREAHEPAQLTTFRHALAQQIPALELERPPRQFA